MTRILLTAFEPYEPWDSNASWLALIELTRELDLDSEITTRLYPVDLEAMKAKLAGDLKANYDFVFHVGQAPKSCCIQLEEFAVNLATPGKDLAQMESPAPVSDGGPGVYRSQLPLSNFARGLREAGIPARVSYHAGTFLCNAILYWSRQLSDDFDLPTRSVFVHVPLETAQVIELEEPTPFMPKEMVADALRRLIGFVTSDVFETIHQAG